MSSGAPAQVPEEALMLTGDENIVDINFTVFWVVKDAQILPVQHPQPRRHGEIGGGERDARGRRRDPDRRRAGRGPRQDRNRNREAVAGDPQFLRRRDRGHAGAVAEGRSAGPGHRSRSATCSARWPTASGCATRPKSYRNDILPKARGDAARIGQEAEAYRAEVVARAQGDADRFIAVYKAYKASEDVTAQRLYIETMEEILKNSNKVIIDKAASGQSGVLPYLPLPSLARASTAVRPPAAAPHPAAHRRRRRRTRGQPVMSRRLLIASAVAADRRRHPGERARCSSSIRPRSALVLQFGQPRREVRDPGLWVKRPFVENVVFYDSRVLDFEPPPEEVIVSDQKRLVVDTYARYRITNPLLFYQTVGTEEGVRGRLSAIVSGSLRRVLGNITLSDILSEKRAGDHACRSATRWRARPRLSASIVVDVRLRRADLPAENSEAIYARMQSERQQQAAQYRGEGAEAAQTVRARAERERTVIIAEAQRERADHARRRRRARRSRSMPRHLARTSISSPSIARCRPIATALGGTTPRSC